MSDAVQVAVITGAFVLVSQAWASHERRKIGERVKTIEHQTNSMSAALVEAAKIISYAEGFKAGKAIPVKPVEIGGE